MNIRQLRKLVLETVSEERRRPSRRKRRAIKENRSKKLARILLEADKELKEQEEGGAAPAATANYADMELSMVGLDAGNVYDTVTDSSEGDLNDLQKNIIAQDKNMPKDKAGFSAYAKEQLPEKEEFIKRYNEVVAKVKSDGGRGFHKAYMPALEGDDAPQVSQALTDENAPFGIDVDASQGKFADILAKAKNIQIDGKNLLDMTAAEMAQKKDQIKTAMKENSWFAGDLLLEFSPHDSFPWPGAKKAIDGAKTLGKGAPILKADQITGPAALFLTLGHFDDAPDKLELPSEPGSVTAGQAKPTQTNIQLAKSLRFALNNMYGKWDTEGMGGAYATKDGDILDGHHRWSSQYLRNGAAADLPGLYKIQAPFSQDLLKMLTAIGNAMGRGTKEGEPDAKKEAAWHKGNVINENAVINRWNKLAGLLKD